MTNWKKSQRELLANNIQTYEDLPEYIIDYLKTAIKFEGKYYINNSLAGHIENEYAYPPRDKKIDEFFIKSIFKSPMLVSYLQTFNLLTNDAPIVLESMWCNFMRKQEFNPIHSHFALFSFIVFLKIPYDLIKEDKIWPNTYGEKSCTSRLEFITFNPLGNIINPITVNVDKSFENKMLMFPSNMPHQVYPFYTSDDERITVSGNLKFDTVKMSDGASSD